MSFKYLYVRNDWKKRHITILSQVFTENDKKFVKFAWAFCHNKDKFVKREGRELAQKRLNEMTSGFSDVSEISDFKFYKISYQILKTILESETTPRKYSDDIQEDMFFYLQFSGENPSFTSILNQVLEFSRHET